MLILQRLFQQRLTHHPFTTPVEVVTWLSAVQAQDYSGAKWALGLRMQPAADRMIEQAFTDGAILRTHVMRPTWHFVTPADIRWLLELTAQRVKVASAYYRRQHQLDDRLLDRSNAIIARAVEGGHSLTRAELGAALDRAGIAAEGNRLSHIVMQAELDALVCSGPRRGKQFTYALLDERAPQAKRLPRDEALAELTRRYFTGHGPATAQDFAWWSGLTLADVKTGLEMAAAHLIQKEIDGQTYWFSASTPPIPEPSQAAFFLPTYDELWVGYTSFNKSRLGERDASESSEFNSTIVCSGRVIGSWRRTFQKGAALIEVKPSAPLTSAESEAVNRAAQAYGRFFEMPVILI
jgi:hypothetical protein